MAQRMQTTNRKYSTVNKLNYLPDFEGDQKDQRSWIWWTYAWLKLAKCCVKPGGVFIIFTDWRQYPALTDALQWSGWQWRGCAVWDKINARPQKGRPRQQCEFLIWGSNDKLPSDREVPILPGLYQYTSPPTNQRVHQTQKPVELMRDLVKFCEPGGKILDPFMGSGTTILASLLEGYTSIGIEKSKEIFEAAEKRLNDSKRCQFGS